MPPDVFEGQIKFRAAEREMPSAGCRGCRGQIVKLDGHRFCGAGMLFQCKIGELKTVGRVASGAIGRSVVDDKLALMIVGMAGRTSVVGKRVGKTV